MPLSHLRIASVVALCWSIAANLAIALGPTEAWGIISEIRGRSILVVPGDLALALSAFPVAVCALVWCQVHRRTGRGVFVFACLWATDATLHFLWNRRSVTPSMQCALLASLLGGGACAASARSIRQFSGCVLAGFVGECMVIFSVHLAPGAMTVSALGLSQRAGLFVLLVLSVGASLIASRWVCVMSSTIRKLDRLEARSPSEE